MIPGISQKAKEEKQKKRTTVTVVDQRKFTLPNITLELVDEDKEFGKPLSCYRRCLSNEVREMTFVSSPYM